MSLVLLLGLFLLKHALLAHVVDFGYSYSRTPDRPYWVVGLALHMLAEAAVSMFLLSQMPWRYAVVVLVTEQIALVVSTLMERRAPMSRLLYTHFFSEAMVAATYTGLMVYLAVVL